MPSQGRCFGATFPGEGFAPLFFGCVCALLAATGADHLAACNIAAEGGRAIRDGPAQPARLLTRTKTYPAPLQDKTTYGGACCRRPWLLGQKALACTLPCQRGRAATHGTAQEGGTPQLSTPPRLARQKCRALGSTKTLLKVLRHKRPERGIEIGVGGWVPTKNFISLAARKRGVGTTVMHDTVCSDPVRFELRIFGDASWVCATYGHSGMFFVSLTYLNCRYGRNRAEASLPAWPSLLSVSSVLSAHSDGLHSWMETRGASTCLSTSVHLTALHPSAFLRTQIHTIILDADAAARNGAIFIFWPGDGCCVTAGSGMCISLAHIAHVAPRAASIRSSLRR